LIAQYRANRLPGLAKMTRFSQREVSRNKTLQIVGNSRLGPQDHRNGHRPRGKFPCGGPSGPPHLAMRSFDRLVPIWLKVVTIWLDEVSRKNLLESLAQFLSSVEVGEPSVFTWII
jgi:hypothetical protein